MKTTFIIGAFMLFFWGQVRAQNDVDAIRYSQTYLGGTAKSMSMAGAMGAIGADASSSSFNPAGLGVYHRTEYAVSPSLLFSSSSVDYRGTKRENSDEHFNFKNFSLVFAQKANGKDLSYWQFSFGMNETANYTGYSLMEGRNTDNSLLDYYVNVANEDNYAPDEVWETYLLNKDENGNYYSVIPAHSDIRQRETKETGGYQREIYFAGGLNFSNRVYAGLSIGVPRLHYDEYSIYSEMDDQKVVDGFDHFDLKETLLTTGSGINIKYGMIFKATDWLRLGATIHSPTWFQMSDIWSGSMTSDIDTASYTFEPEDGEFNYQLKTPWRTSGSIGIIFGKHGLLDVDVDYVDYTSMRLRSKDYDFIPENESIHNKYRATQNIRVGGEYNLGIFVLRGGYAYYGSPFADGINDGSRQFFTGGIGYRSSHFFTDLAYIHSIKKEDYYPYSVSGITPANITGVRNSFTVTAGFRF